MKLVIQAWFHDMPAEFGDDAVLTVQLEVDPEILNAMRADRADYIATMVHNHVLSAMRQKKWEAAREWKLALPPEMAEQGWVE